MYSQTVWTHIQRPQNQGAVGDCEAAGEAFYPKCGDRLQLGLSVADGRIAVARFEAGACGPVVAAASVGTELLKGRTIEEARGLSPYEIDQPLQLPPPKRHAILMFLDCLHQALDHLERSS